jgi:hypothetical protein
MNGEILKLRETSGATILRPAGWMDSLFTHGKYFAKGFDKYGKLLWEDTIDNVVTIVGKNLALDTFLAGSGYSVVGPFMSLISSVSYTGVPVEADTMGSHGTWYEVSATTYYPTIANRITTNGGWSAAANKAKALSSALSFSIITNGGTVKGCFLVYGSGAVNTLGSTAGTLLSAGTFTGGDKAVGVGDTLQVSYSMSM